MQTAFGFVDTRQPVAVALGLGVDSVAMTVEMIRRKIRIDAILFANAGSEKRETYAYLPVFNRYLREHGYPEVTVVNYAPVSAPYHTLEGNMILNATLPGATFNIGSCTMKFKIEPQQKWTNNWAPAREAWARGQRVMKLIGFESGEDHRLARADAKAHSGKGDPNDALRYEYVMPLMDWGWDRERCIEEIIAAGLPVPPKSACYFCPNTKPHEVDTASPEDRARTMLIELTAEPYNTQVRGLWRRPRKADGRPGSVTEYILEKGLDFVPLTDIAGVIVLNEKCKKARTGATFESPHTGPTLRAQLIAAGHSVPEVVTEWDGVTPRYTESRREADLETETQLHRSLWRLFKTYDDEHRRNGSFQFA